MSVKLSPTIFIIIPVLILCSWNVLTLQEVMEKTEARKSDSYQPGRYTIVRNPEMRKDTFLLDTATGDTWGSYGDGNGDIVGWERLTRN